MRLNAIENCEDDSFATKINQVASLEQDVLEVLDATWPDECPMLRCACAKTRALASHKASFCTRQIQASSDLCVFGALRAQSPEAYFLRVDGQIHFDVVCNIRVFLATKGILSMTNNDYNHQSKSMARLRTTFWKNGVEPMIVTVMRATSGSMCSMHRKPARL